MTTNLHRKERFYFRIVGMPSELLEELKKHTVGHTIKTAKYRNTDSLVCSLEIMADHDYRGLSSFLSASNIPSDTYGVYISLVTERDNDGVHVPDYALQFFHVIGGNIDFSFVSTGVADAQKQEL